MYTKKDDESYLSEIKQAMPETPTERYQRDPVFSTLVEQMYRMLRDNEFGITLSDLLDAARIAGEKHDRYLKTFGCRLGDWVMTVDTTANIAERALAAWGENAQIDIAIEECAELITALLDRRRGRGCDNAVAEEIADVEIMLSQLRIMIGKERCFDALCAKWSRLEKRLDASYQAQRRVKWRLEHTKD
jgi:hypothetical protein